MREVVKVEVHRLILIFKRSLIHFTFIFFSPIKMLTEKFVQAGFKCSPLYLL